MSLLSFDATVWRSTALKTMVYSSLADGLGKAPQFIQLVNQLEMAPANTHQLEMGPHLGGMGISILPSETLVDILWMCSF